MPALCVVPMMFYAIQHSRVLTREELNSINICYGLSICSDRFIDFLVGNDELSLMFHPLLDRASLSFHFLSWLKAAHSPLSSTILVDFPACRPRSQGKPSFFISHLISSILL